jgi:transposase
MSSVVTDHGVVHLGLDVHKNTISAGILEPGAETAVVDKISSDAESVRRLVARFDDPRRVRACYATVRSSGVRAGGDVAR